MSIKSSAHGSANVPNQHAARFLTAIETAVHVGLPPSALEEMRRENRGPTYYRLGSDAAGKIVYMLEDLDAWLQRERPAINSPTSP